MKKYQIICPNCNATFDCSAELIKWKNELLQKIKELIDDEIGGYQGE